MSGGGPRRGASERGAAAVEFALIAPLLLMLVLGILSYGYMISFRQALSQGAAEGARAVVVSPYPSGDPRVTQSGLDAVNDALGSYGITCAGAAAGSALTRGTSPAVRVGSCSLISATCVSDPGHTCVTVSLDYAYKDNPLTPSFPGIGLVLPTDLEYHAVARVS